MMGSGSLLPPLSTVMRGYLAVAEELLNSATAQARSRQLGVLPRALACSSADRRRHRTDTKHG
jgi:hypothetical protein